MQVRDFSFILENSFVYWHCMTAFTILQNPYATFNSLKVVTGVTVDAFSMWGW